MDILLSSFSLVLLAEIGDKTQLLSILLAARFKKFWPIFLGIFCATILNHAISAMFGDWLAENISRETIIYFTSAIFVFIGLWVLVPDKKPDEDKKRYRHGAFIASLITFFIAEIGDKTQVATITLAAQFCNVPLVTIGTTLGMLAANAPAILFGEKLLKMIPLKTVRIVASALFILFGIAGIVLVGMS